MLPPGKCRWINPSADWCLFYTVVPQKNRIEAYQIYRHLKRAHRHFNRPTRLEMSAQRMEKITDRFSPNKHKRYLRVYCNKVHQILIHLCSCIMASVNALMQIALLHSVLKRQRKDWRQSNSPSAKSSQLIGYYSNGPWAISKRTSD